MAPKSLRPGISATADYFLRIARSFAMNLFASAVPAINRAGRDFRAERCKVDFAERRTAFFTVDRARDEGEPFRLRRRGPPPNETLKSGGG